MQGKDSPCVIFIQPTILITATSSVLAIRAYIAKVILEINISDTLSKPYTKSHLNSSVRSHFPCIGDVYY